MEKRNKFEYICWYLLIIACTILFINVVRNSLSLRSIQVDNYFHLHDGTSFVSCGEISNLCEDDYN